jgi:phenylalanyl-tRNA synthetase beta chain
VDGSPLQIVCGAANVAAGQKVPVATIGTVLYDKEVELYLLKKVRLEVKKATV